MQSGLRGWRWGLGLMAAGLFAGVGQLISAPPRTVTGIVTHDLGPASHARVRFKATKVSGVADAQGRFSLVGDGQRITAWLDGYFIAGQTVPPGEAHVRLALHPLPSEDHPDYAWVDPRPDAAREHACANCHAEIFKEWSASAHARGPLQKHFQSFYAGIDYAGQPDRGWSLLKEHPEGAGVCAACHAPTVDFLDEAFTDLRRVQGVSVLGIHCDYCHKIADTSLEKLGLEHGRLAHRLLRPKDGQLFFGPLDDVDRGEDTYSPIYRESRYCASCHEGTVLGTKVYTTYSEWLASPASRKGQSCQSCHMAPSGRMTNFAPGHGGVERDPLTLATHGTPGSDVATLKSCLSLEVQIERKEGQVTLTTTTLAKNVGHRVPTGFVDRHLLLIVDAVDDQGHAVAALTGPTLPAAAGTENHQKGAYAGMSGWYMGRRLAGPEGFWPVPFWRMDCELEDTRLHPERPDRRVWTFPLSARECKVLLLYRRFYHQQAEHKHLPDNDLLLHEHCVTVPIR